VEFLKKTTIACALVTMIIPHSKLSVRPATCTSNPDQRPRLELPSGLAYPDQLNPQHSNVNDIAGISSDCGTGSVVFFMLLAPAFALHRLFPLALDRARLKRTMPNIGKCLTSRALNLPTVHPFP